MANIKWSKHTLAIICWLTVGLILTTIGLCCSAWFFVKRSMLLLAVLLYFAIAMVLTVGKGKEK